MQHERKGPGSVGALPEALNHTLRNCNSTALTSHRVPALADAVNVLLGRLHNVRRHGEAWRADCPMGHSSRGLLSITTGDDGRVLTHCFVGCHAAEIVGAVGLRLADLYPPRITRMTPEERRRARLRAREANWAAALGVLAAESTTVVVSAVMVARGEPLTPDDIHRLHVASNRIHDAQEVLR